jgi:hypothetical protein
MDEIKLTSGKILTVHRGILGLSLDEDEERGTLFEGYDGYVQIDGEEEWSGNMALTYAERRELATMMIERWRTWVDHG